MKKPFLVAALSLFALAAFPACMATTTAGRAYVYAPPPASYVYAYPEGCWADGIWYAPCPWSPGPRFGYYVYQDGGYRWMPGYRWEYRPGYPPPRHWRRPAPPPRPHRPAHPHARPPRRF